MTGPPVELSKLEMCPCERITSSGSKLLQVSRVQYSEISSPNSVNDQNTTPKAVRIYLFRVIETLLNHQKTVHMQRSTALFLTSVVSSLSSEFCAQTC